MVQKYTKPSGHCTQTLQHCGSRRRFHLGLRRHLQRDAGASGVDVLPYTLKSVERLYTQGGRVNPVVRLQKYWGALWIGGVASGKFMKVRYALVLRS